MSTLENLDQVMASAEKALSNLSGKLSGVQNDVMYCAVTGTGGFNDPQFVGETKKVVAGARENIEGVWQVISVASQRLDEARSKRATFKTGLFGTTGGTIKEVEDSVSGATLTFAPDVVAKMPAVLKGQLFGTRTPFVTSVIEAFNGADAVLRMAAGSIIEVENCQAALKGHVAEVEKRLEEVLPIVSKVGGSALLAHKNALAGIAAVKSTYPFDPLGVNRNFDQQVDQHINTINRAIDTVQKAKEKAYAEYGDAQVLMQRIEDRQPTLARAPELRDWLNKLVKRLEQEEWAAASSGLEDWTKEARGVLGSKPTQAPAPAPQPHQQPHQQPAYTPPPPRPPVHTAPPPPVRVEQLPTSGNYQKYEPPHKSTLERLLDGELKTKTPPALAPVDHPVDPAVDKLVSSRTPPSAPPPTSVSTSNPGLDKLVNGPRTMPGIQPGQTPPAPGKTQAPTPTPAPVPPAPPHNQALDDLLSGRKPATPAGTPGAPTGAPNTALGDLIEGRKPKVTTPPPPPAPAPVPVPAPVTTPPPPTPAPPSAPASPVPPTNDEASKLTELFGAKKTAPPQTPSNGQAPAPGAPSRPLSQAEQDEAARKALENLLKKK